MLKIGSLTLAAFSRSGSTLNAGLTGARTARNLRARKGELLGQSQRGHCHLEEDAEAATTRDRVRGFFVLLMERRRLVFPWTFVLLASRSCIGIYWRTDHFMRWPGANLTPGGAVVER